MNTSFDSISISKPQFVLNFFDEFKLFESCMIFLVGNNRAVRFLQNLIQYFQNKKSKRAKF